VVWVDGEKKFGVSSKHRTYSELIDGTRARFWLARLLRKYPDLRDIHAELDRKNPGWGPYDAMYHAEATLLLRLAEERNGTLAGRTLDIFVDRPFCGSCKKVLPFLARELGNPTLNITDADGIRWTIKDLKLSSEKVRP
jgi:hypothetical protein